MKNKYYILVLILLVSGLFTTQTVQAQELQLSGSAYLTNKSARNDKLMDNFQNGLIIGLAYRQYFSDKWSIGIGASYLKGKFHYNRQNLEGSYPTIDGENDDFEFRYNAFSYRESEKWNTLRIPLTIQFETGADDLRWYILTGPLIDLVMGTSNGKMEWKNLQTSGFYEQWNAVLTGPKFVGFGDMGNKKGKEEIQFKNALRWELETGIKTLMGKHRLYIGAFFDLGLNDFRPKESGDNEAIQYVGSGDKPLEFHSVWTQKSLKNKELKNSMFGIRIRYGLSLK